MAAATPAAANPADATSAAATLAATDGRDGVRLAFAGALDSAGAAQLWPEAVKRARGQPRLVLDLGGVTALDTAGAVLLLQLADEAGGATWDIPPGPLRAVLDRTRTALAAPQPPPPPPELPLVAQVGRGTLGWLDGVKGLVAFMGETVVSAARIPRQPRLLRVSELARHLDEAGLRAFGLTILLGVLIGLILAFQSSVPLRQFGAQSFLPNLVGISLLRELGPLMAAVILSGRTGSAYAAEIGTMVVNEEVDALRVMGIDPVAWLVVPRLLAAMMVMPVLALVMNLSGLIGMGAVMATLGFPPTAVANALKGALSMKDLLGGLFKAAVFGLVIGMVGCRAGLGAGRGPRAVGDAATSAVVGGIVATVLLDGVFAVLFFRLGL